MEAITVPRVRVRRKKREKKRRSIAGAPTSSATETAPALEGFRGFAGRCGEFLELCRRPAWDGGGGPPPAAPPIANAALECEPPPPHLPQKIYPSVVLNCMKRRERERERVVALGDGGTPPPTRKHHFTHHNRGGGGDGGISVTLVVGEGVVNCKVLWKARKIWASGRRGGGGGGMGRTANGPYPPRRGRPQLLAPWAVWSLPEGKISGKIVQSA